MSSHPETDVVAAPPVVSAGKPSISGGGSLSDDGDVSAASCLQDDAPLASFLDEGPDPLAGVEHGPVLDPVAA